MASVNKFCRSTDLSNGASVESFVVLRLLAALVYEDREICPKKAIDEVRVPRGRKRELYKPDFLLECENRPRWGCGCSKADRRSLTRMILVLEGLNRTTREKE